MTKPIAARIFSLLVLIIAASAACNTTGVDQELKSSLNLAGKNKKELTKVIHHYKKNPADSLKLRAAQFLIKNMQWHYGKQVKPSEELWKLFVLEDSLIRPLLREPDSDKSDRALYGYKYGAKKMLIADALRKTEINEEYQPDLITQSASAIIENIDAAFQVKELEWCRNLGFDEFCEYILSYRFNNEAVYPIRQKLRSHFAELYRKDEDKMNGWQTIAFMNNLLSHFNWDWDDPSSFSSMGFYNIFFWHQENFTCSQHIAVLGQMMRSAGLPVTEVFTPNWRDNSLGHSWCAIPAADDSLVLFSAVYQNPGDIYLPHSPLMATKLYMKTFASQPDSPFFLKTEDEELPPSFKTPCLKDVTAEFVPVNDVEIKLNSKVPDVNLCWFSVFIQGNWTPVGWGKINRKTNTIDFESIPVGLTGIAGFYINGRITPCSEMFTVLENGIEIIRPGTETSNLLLTRKFPVKTRMQYFIGDIIGTKIQGASQGDFSDSVTLYTIQDTLLPYLQDIAFKNEDQFRYYRLYAPSWGLHIAELEFLCDNPVDGAVEATSLPVFAKNEHQPKKYFKYTGSMVAQNPDSTVFDGDMLTYSGEKWIGLDLGKPQNVKRIRIAPRNAHNGVVAGDHYELYYWNNEWIPVGKKQAINNYIEFEDIPENTLYWLRNLDHGKEEQPFFYENGKQFFSNQ